ncbi:hypothetical protein STRAU_5235 [Streptomyces aurantiacus JA 4570]|uniref:Uncharacterized protein n=1 Tax=Streptomyces aurantiacus JA 4570 TaxID=1286094 RepID=S3ZEY6_9ACTN|nr:hypothetical protein STRAU_5235 [Streptomyces aurantiacus JA 4570]
MDSARLRDTRARSLHSNGTRERTHNAILEDGPPGRGYIGPRRGTGHERGGPSWSGWRDLNPRPSAPKADALPSCATPRRCDT